jgi:Rieske Fe-S protein
MFEDEDLEKKSGRIAGLSRRTFMKGVVAAGVVGVLGGAVVSTGSSLLPPPQVPKGTLKESLVFTRFSTEQWWDSLAGQDVRVSDFDMWDGATAVWQGIFDDLGRRFPGTGFPVIVIKLPKAGLRNTDDPRFQDLFVERGEEVMVAYLDRCVHLCCFPGWHIEGLPTKPPRNYLADPVTLTEYQQEPIFCVCHGSQYDPLTVAVDLNPVTRVDYPGARHVHGPADRGLPIVPLEDRGGRLFGVMDEEKWPDQAKWYIYC